MSALRAAGPADSQRVLYSTNQNAARNAALAHAAEVARAEWALVFDGHIFISAETWSALERATARAEQRGLLALQASLGGELVQTI